MPSVAHLLLAVAVLPALVAAQSANTEAEQRGVKQSKGAAALFLILYLSATLVQWTHYFRNKHKPRAYMLNLTIGMLCMSLGFLIRITGNYAWQFLLTFLSPCAFYAADYTILKHLARAVGPEVSSACLFMPARAIVWVFLLSDVVTFCAQTAGTVMTIIGGDLLSIGEKIAIAGLILQLISFSLFSILLIVFARRLSRNYPSVWRGKDAGGNFLRCWRTQPVDDVRLMVRILGLTCIGLIIRAIFRTVEQADGFFGYIATTEIFFYLFDATPLWLSMALFVFVWPTRYVAGAEEGAAAKEMGGSSWRQGGVVEMGPFADPQLIGPRKITRAEREREQQRRWEREQQQRGGRQQRY
ncbi:hypothetical protein JCM6882_000472 [Rhodosporidiobolus microsporus]